MSKEATKRFIENNGFICNRCAKVVVDGTKHKNEEDLCDQCKIADLEAKLAKIERYYNENIAITEKQFAQIEELKEKLAEKEKDLIIKCRTIEVLIKKNEKNNKDKISSIVVELEKVRKYVDGRTYLAQYIDDRIKMLKEVK